MTDLIIVTFLLSHAHNREKSDADIEGQKRCDNYGYEKCQTFQQLNIDGLGGTTIFPNGEKVSISFFIHFSPS